ncbi:uncharacterized protein LOC120557125 [Perca fluviatilis]|uniref:uncharacterized protein LOC120557125 n=1 Tax=Perca fluviatilis TaxID=8168 RepID=UPI0019668D4B|nr:uncharacterized protein LOC120557125 [Perca fluviatilis]
MDAQAPMRNNCVMLGGNLNKTWAKNITVLGGTDAVLPCSLSTKENTEFKLFDWRKVPQKDDGLKEVFMYDAGIHYNNGRGGQSEEFKDGVLKDRSEENIPGAASKPKVTILDQQAQVLQCEVHGNPKPEVKWQDSDGNILHAKITQVSEREGSFNITLQTTVTKTDTYRCVATQLEIKHQIYAETSVHISVSESWNGWIVVLFLVVVVAAGVLAVLVYKGYILQNAIQLNRRPKVIKVEEGSDVTLPCSLWPKEDLQSTQFIWQKISQNPDDGHKVFLYDKGDLYSDERPGQSEQFKGRVSHFPDELEQGNASITTRNTTRADSGDYRCIVPLIQKPQIFYIKLVVVGSTPESDEHHSLMME